VPKCNLAARTVARAEAGLLVEPRDEVGLLNAVRRLIEEPELRVRLATNGRRYALTHFDIRAITNRFERILDGQAESRLCRKHDVTMA
jgi:glycosyltransferase involved in cell wall biosynthesis